MMNTIKRILLTLFLILILIGMTGHWANTTKITAHASSESVCVIHAGILLPEQPKSTPNNPDLSLLTTPDQTIPWRMREKISHPPTF